MSRDAAVLIEQIKTATATFDQWLDSEIQLIHDQSSAKKQVEMKRESEIAALQKDKQQIEAEIAESKRKQAAKNQALDEQARSQSILRTEILSIPKELDYLKKHLFLLQTKHDRLMNLEVSDDSTTVKELRAFESLYGFTVQQAGNKLTFTFDKANRITIEEDAQHVFAITYAPVSLRRVQSSLLEELNRTRNLYKFLLGVRAAL